MPAAAAASLIDVVLAERQPDSEPTCEKPRVMVFLAPLPVDEPPPVSFLPQAASARPTTTRPALPERPVRKDLLLIIAAPLWTDAVASGGAHQPPQHPPRRARSRTASGHARRGGWTTFGWWRGVPRQMFALTICRTSG